jgi:hypothetical protein
VTTKLQLIVLGKPIPPSTKFSPLWVWKEVNAECVANEEF